MKFEFKGLNWGDILYYIDIDAKNKKIVIKRGALVSIIASFAEYIFRLRNEAEDKEIDVASEWCSTNFENLASMAQSMMEDINKHNLWSSFEED